MNLIKLFLSSVIIVFGIYLLAIGFAIQGIQIFANTFFTQVGALVFISYGWVTGIIIKK